MQQPAYQRKLESMVPDQREILVDAAFGESRVWESLAALYQFSESDQRDLRSYIFRTYAPDGRSRLALRSAPGDAYRHPHVKGAAVMRD